MVTSSLQQSVHKKDIIFTTPSIIIIITRIKNIKNVTRCRDSRSAKSI